MNYEMIINNILYGFSGFCFAIFASRFSLLSTANIIEAYRNSGFSGILSKWYMIGFIICAGLIFPMWFFSRTLVGGAVYYIVLFYFLHKGLQAYRDNSGKAHPVKQHGKKTNKWR